MNAWISADKCILVAFDSAVLATFAGHAQLAPNATECGGILLGMVRGNNLQVTEATTPFPRDKQKRFCFERTPYGHRKIAAARWLSSSGLVRYLGEWHTHPEDTPSPSEIDRNEWATLAARRKDGRPTLSIIVGRSNFYVALVAKDGILQQLVRYSAVEEVGE